MKKLNEINISGVSLPLYAFIVIVLAVTIAMGKLPLNMLGLTLLLVVMGHLFYFIGEKLPIVNSYLGGGSVFTLLGATLLATFHVIPAKYYHSHQGLLGDSFGFLDFYIAALICGAILGMNRNLLVKASARFIPVSLVTMVVGALCWDRWKPFGTRIWTFNSLCFLPTNGRRNGSWNPASFKDLLCQSPRKPSSYLLSIGTRYHTW